LLVELYESTLQNGPISPDDDFFARGGTSLQAVILLRRMNEELQFDVPITLVLENPTVRMLADKLEHILLDSPDASGLDGLSDEEIKTLLAPEQGQTPVEKETSK
jgi:hypothetical protein